MSTVQIWTCTALALVPTKVLIFRFCRDPYPLMEITETLCNLIGSTGFSVEADRITAGIFRRFELQQQLVTQSTLVKVALANLFCSGPDTITD